MELLCQMEMGNVFEVRVVVENDEIIKIDKINLLNHIWDEKVHIFIFDILSFFVLFSDWI